VFPSIVADEHQGLYHSGEAGRWVKMMFEVRTGLAAERRTKLRAATEGAALVLLAALCPALTAVLAAEAPAPAADKARTVRVRQLPGGLVTNPALKPALTIPVAPLGYTTPGAIYLGQRNSLVSLDFVDEDRLLFTFRVPGLLRRAADEVRQSTDRSEVRQIRALVLRLPAGTIDTEAIWTVHDRARYLWMLRDGQFLLRDGNAIQLGDLSLELKPWLHLPGPVLWLELDPEERYIIVTSSREPEKAQSRTGSHADDAADQDARPDIVLRVVRRDPSKVLLESHVRGLTHLAFNSEGYVEALRSRGINWMLNLNYFSGGSRLMGSMESTCTPRIDFLAPAQMLTTGCGVSGERRLGGISTAGELKWLDEAASTSVWPEMVRSANGARLVEETLEASHAVSATSPLDAGDIRGQAVRVLDAATGDLQFETVASPVYDAGGNVALSPSGRRLAVLNNGALEIYDLPAPAVPPSPAAGQNLQ
jgi:hypothetical protein